MDIGMQGPVPSILAGSSDYNDELVALVQSDVLKVSDSL